MTTPVLEKLSDIATEAHTLVQQNHLDINPVVGISRSMRASGFAADAMTIDCLKTKRRIILILQDNLPEVIRYQFAFKNKDPSDHFEVINFSQLTVEKLYDWIVSYFTEKIN
ncbi:MAG: hypothetical protein KUG78_01880 [Kangiellaceae bacterium]|nr:hypothetical protein [Kangiellaceae bacterium]